MRDRSVWRSGHAGLRARRATSCRLQGSWPVTLAALLGLLGPTAAAEPGASLQRIGVAPHLRPSLWQPLRLARGGDRPRPAAWVSSEELITRPPLRLWGLASVAKPGTPVYDFASQSWYASANGCLVRLLPDGGLPVLLCGVQGIDVDVRASQGLAVSREPDHTIVLHRWGRAPLHRVLLRGDHFHGPRLSPDGQQVLVQESRASGGHVWLAGVGGRATDLGPGSSAAWLPDGRRIIYSQVSSDGYRVTAPDLVVMDVVTRRSVCLGRTPAVAEVNPVVSPDGTRVAFLDARSGDLYVAELPPEGR